MASFNSDDGINFKTRSASDIPDGYIYQKSRTKTSFSNSGSYYPRSNSSVELGEGTAGDIPGIGSIDDFDLRRRAGAEVTAMDTVPSYSNQQAYGGKMRQKRADSWSRRYNDASARNENFNMTTKRNDFRSSVDRGLFRDVFKVFFLAFIKFLTYCKSVDVCLRGADALCCHNIVCRMEKHIQMGG